MVSPSTPSGCGYGVLLAWPLILDKLFTVQSLALDASLNKKKLKHSQIKAKIRINAINLPGFGCKYSLVRSRISSTRRLITSVF